MVYNSEYRIYKPSKDFNKGAATIWEWNPDKGTFWLSIAKQLEKQTDGGHAQFDWNNKGTMRLDLIDIADILLVLENHKKFTGQYNTDKPDRGTGLYHQTPAGNTILELFKHPKDQNRFILSFSSKKNNVLFRAMQSVSQQESMILSTLLRNVVWNIYTIKTN